MALNVTNQINQASTSLRNHAGATAGKDGELGKADFLNLFMTQMSQQDPMDPMDSGQMMSQIAQMGSMEQLQNINQGISAMNKTQMDIAKFAALDYLDQDVSYNDDSLSLKRGHSSDVSYTLNGNAQKLIARIKDHAGEVIRTEELSDIPSGRHLYQWNGKDNTGVLMGDGNYQVSFVALSDQGREMPVETFKTQRVSQIRYEKGRPMLQLKDKTIAASDVKFVDQKLKNLIGDARPLPLIERLAPKGIKE